MLNKLLLLLCGAMLAGCYRLRAATPMTRSISATPVINQVVVDHIPNSTPDQRYTLRMAMVLQRIMSLH